MRGSLFFSKVTLQCVFFVLTYIQYLQEIQTMRTNRFAAEYFYFSFAGYYYRKVSLRSAAKDE